MTVTPPEVQRSCRLIPEAVPLVLQAAALGQSGAVYVLEMARNLMRLSGCSPDEEIPMTCIGVRPGEKLFEELVGVDETVQPSGVEQIFQVQVGHLPETTWLMQTIATLERCEIGRAHV